MGTNRTERINSLMLREIATDLHRVMASDVVDLGKVSITRVDITPNLRNADVWVSIMDKEHAGAWLRRLARHAADFQTLINRNMTLKYTPRLRFRLDDSIAAGDHVLSLLHHMDPLDNDEDRIDDFDEDQGE